MSSNTRKRKRYIIRDEHIKSPRSTHRYDLKPGPHRNILERLTPHDRQLIANSDIDVHDDDYVGDSDDSSLEDDIHCGADNCNCDFALDMKEDSDKLKRKRVVHLDVDIDDDYYYSDINYSTGDELDAIDDDEDFSNALITISNDSTSTSNRPQRRTVISKQLMIQQQRNKQHVQILQHQQHTSSKSDEKIESSTIIPASNKLNDKLELSSVIDLTNDVEQIDLTDDNDEIDISHVDINNVNYHQYHNDDKLYNQISLTARSDLAIQNVRMNKLIAETDQLSQASIGEIVKLGAQSNYDPVLKMVRERLVIYYFRIKAEFASYTKDAQQLLHLCEIEEGYRHVLYKKCSDMIKSCAGEIDFSQSVYYVASKVRHIMENIHNIRRFITLTFKLFSPAAAFKEQDMIITCDEPSTTISSWFFWELIRSGTTHLLLLKKRYDYLQLSIITSFFVFADTGSWKYILTCDKLEEFSDDIQLVLQGPQLIEYVPKFVAQSMVEIMEHCTYELRLYAKNEQRCRDHKVSIKYSNDVAGFSTFCCCEGGIEPNTSIYDDQTFRNMQFQDVQQWKLLSREFRQELRPYLIHGDDALVLSLNQARYLNSPVARRSLSNIRLQQQQTLSSNSARSKKRRYVDDPDLWTFKSTRHIKKGEEILLDYKLGLIETFVADVDDEQLFDCYCSNPHGQTSHRSSSSAQSSKKRKTQAARYQIAPNRLSNGNCIDYSKGREKILDC